MVYHSDEIPLDIGYSLRAILCKYGASYIGTISRSDSDFDETC